MKVLVVFTYGYSLKTWKESGTLNKELEIYHLLSNKYNINFTFITYGDENDTEIEISNSKFSVLPVYKNVKLFKSKLLNFIVSFFIPIILYKKIDSLKEFDIIKQNQLMGSWVSLILKLLLKKPLFLRTGYDMYKFSKQDNKSKLKIFLYKLLTNVSFKYSDVYSVSNKTDFDTFTKDYPKQSEKLILRPNLISENLSKIDNKRFEKNILCVGRLEMQKNFEFIIQEFKNSGYIIDLVGEGSQKEYLMSLAYKNNVKINFFGRLENEVLNNMYQKYKYFINASLFEGNPKTVLEALSNGCIVFVSNIPNHSEIITNKINGYIFELENTSLISTFKNRNFDLDDIISNNAALLINQKYSLDTGAEIEHDDYKKLVGYH